MSFADEVQCVWLYNQQRDWWNKRCLSLSSWFRWANRWIRKLLKRFLFCRKTLSSGRNTGRSYSTNEPYTRRSYISSWSTDNFWLRACRYQHENRVHRKIHYLFAMHSRMNYTFIPRTIYVYDSEVCCGAEWESCRYHLVTIWISGLCIVETEATYWCFSWLLVVHKHYQTSAKRLLKKSR